MKKRNKILIRLLTAILCVSFLPITVMADNDSTNPENHFEAWTVDENNEKSDCANFEIEKNTSQELSVLVSADDESEISYQWFFQDGNYVNGFVDKAIDGATGATYVAGPLTRTTTYMCDVTDSISGITQTVYFYITVTNIRSITFEGYDEQSIYVTVIKGETATFKVNVEADDDEGLVYKWLWNNEVVPGATTDTYTTGPINCCNWLDCQVQDKYGNSMCASATIYFDNELKAWPTDSEDDVASICYDVSPNEQKQLSVSASAIDDSGIKYQWYKRTPDGEDGYYLAELEGKTSPSYTCEPIKLGDSYSCLVEDQLSGQYVYVDFYFSIQNNLSVSLENCEVPEDGEDYAFDVTPGETRTLKVVIDAEDTSDAKYEWRWFDGSGETSTVVEDAITDTFTTPEIRSWSYAECIVTDKYGESGYIVVFFNIDNAFEAWRATGDDDIIVSPGDDAELEVEVSALDTSMITYQWFLDLDDGTSFEDHPITGATDAKYTVKSVTDSSIYVCAAHDGFSGNTWCLYFYVKIDNQFMIKVAGVDTHWYDLNVPVGKTKRLTVDTFANEPDGITYSWYVNDELTEETSDTFVAPAIYEDEYMSVECVAYDKYGNRDSVVYTLRGTNEFEAWVTATSGTKYVSYGATGIDVTPGSYVTLSTSSEWESDLTFEWTIGDGYYRTASEYGYENIRVLSEETGDTIVVGPITTATWASCKMTNEFGNTNTVDFYIWVSNPEFDLSILPDKPMTYTEVYPELGASQDIYAFGLGGGDFERVWYKDDEVIPGATNGRYTIENIQSSGTYRCFAVDRYNNYNIVTYEIIVHNEFKAWASDSGVYERREWVYFTNQDQDPVLSVSTNAEEGSPVSYKWFYSDEPYEEKTLCPDTNNSPTYTIKISEGAAAYDYYWCQVTDQYNNSRWVLFTQCGDETEGEAYAYAWSLFEEDTECNFSYVYVDRGGSATLEVVTAPLDDEKFSFKWYADGICDENLIEGETSYVLHIDSVMEDCEYGCEVMYDGQPLRELFFDVVCLGAWITGTDNETYSSFDIRRGETTTFSVTADDSIESPSYQWYIYDSDAEGYGGYVPIQGANSATYETDPVVKKCDLRCVVTDEDGHEYVVDFWIYVDNSEVEPAKLVASNLTLDGYLKVNFKLTLPDELVNDDGSFIMINDTKYLVSEAEYKSGYYYFTYSVASSEIQKAIVIQAFASNGVEYPLATQSGIDYTRGYTYSIKQYLETVKAMSNEELSAYTNKPEELKALVTRLGEFGTLSQAYFKDNRSSGYISDNALSTVDAIHAEDLAGYQATIIKSPNNGIRYSGNLSLETATHLNHYFTLEDGRSIDEYEIRVNGDLITTESTSPITLTRVGDNKYCLKIDDVAAPDIDTCYSITVVDKQSEETMISVEGFSALSYIYLYLNQYENDPSQVNVVRVMKSLYLYNLAADAYFG